MAHHVDTPRHDEHCDWEWCTRETIVALCLFFFFCAHVWYGDFAIRLGSNVKFDCSSLVGDLASANRSPVVNWLLSIATVGTRASFPMFTSFVFFFWSYFSQDTCTPHLAVVFGQFEHRNTISTRKFARFKRGLDSLPQVQAGLVLLSSVVLPKVRSLFEDDAASPLLRRDCTERLMAGWLLMHGFVATLHCMVGSWETRMPRV